MATSNEELMAMIAKYGDLVIVQDVLFRTYNDILGTIDYSKERTADWDLIPIVMNVSNEIQAQVAEMKTRLLQELSASSVDAWIRTFDKAKIAQPVQGNAPLDPNEPIIIIDNRELIARRIVAALSRGE